MEKPISIMIDETKTNLISTINNSGLPFWLLEPIVKNVYQEIKTLSDNQLRADQQAYKEFLIEEEKKEYNKATEISEETE